jgi:hypothetical protein
MYIPLHLNPWRWQFIAETYWKVQFKYDFQFCYVHTLVYMIQPQPLFFYQCFIPTQNKRQHYSSEHFNHYIFGQYIGRQQESGQNCRRHSLSSILMNEILICFSWTQIFEPCHTFVLPIFRLQFCPAFCSPGMNVFNVFSAFTSRQISYNFSVFLHCTNVFQWNLPIIYGANWYKPLVRGANWYKPLVPGRVMADSLPIFRNLIATG